MVDERAMDEVRDRRRNKTHFSCHSCITSFRRDASELTYRDGAVTPPTAFAPDYDELFTRWISHDFSARDFAFDQVTQEMSMQALLINTIWGAAAGDARSGNG